MKKKEDHDILFSIIVPVYNAQETLEKCFDSISNQTYEHWELLLIDDGSTDLSRDLCDKFAEEDPRVKTFHLSNGGVSRARNFGLNNMNGDYVVFVDSDDYITKDFLQVTYDKFKEECYQLAIIGVNELVGPRIIKQSYSRLSANRIGRKEFLRGIFEPDMYHGYLCNKVFDASIIRDKMLRLNETISICEDILFCFQYGEYIRNAVVIKKAMYMYVRNQNSATHRLDRNRIWSEEKVADYLMNNSSLKTDVSLNISVASFCCNLYMDCIYKGDFKNAIFDRENIYKLIDKIKIIGIEHCSVSTKLQYCLLMVSPTVAYHLYRAFRIIRGKDIK